MINPFFLLFSLVCIISLSLFAFEVDFANPTKATYFGYNCSLELCLSGSQTSCAFHLSFKYLWSFSILLISCARRPDSLSARAVRCFSDSSSLVMAWHRACNTTTTWNEPGEETPSALLAHLRIIMWGFFSTNAPRCSPALVSGVWAFQSCTAFHPCFSQVCFPLAAAPTPFYEAVVETVVGS